MIRPLAFLSTFNNNIYNNSSNNNKQTKSQNFDPHGFNTKNLICSTFRSDTIHHSSRQCLSMDLSLKKPSCSTFRSDTIHAPLDNVSKWIYHQNLHVLPSDPTPYTHLQTMSLDGFITKVFRFHFQIRLHTCTSRQCLSVDLSLKSSCSTFRSDTMHAPRENVTRRLATVFCFRQFWWRCTGTVSGRLLVVRRNTSAVGSI